MTDVDNTWFTLLTNNTNQIHFNTEYAKRTQFKRPLVNSLLTLAIVTGLGVTDVSENGFALGWDAIALPHPVFAGDSRLHAGIGSAGAPRIPLSPGVRHREGAHPGRESGRSGRGREYVRSIMVWKRDRAPMEDLFPTPPAGGAARD